MKKDVVAKLLKLPRKKKKEIFAENTWQVSLCEDKTGMFMTVGPIFSFSDRGVLQEIRFEYMQP